MAKTDETPLEGMEFGHRFDWSDVNCDVAVAATRWAVGLGYAVRIAPVGYGMALRFSLTDSEGQVFGVTLGSAADYNLLCKGLVAEGGDEYVKRHQEAPRTRRRR